MHPAHSPDPRLVHARFGRSGAAVQRAATVLPDKADGVACMQQCPILEAVYPLDRDLLRFREMKQIQRQIIASVTGGLCPAFSTAH